MELRPFRNNDLPLVVDVWRSQAAQRGLMQPMSVALLDQMVLSKPMFDRQGLIVAAEGRQAAGFAHAGFGPSDDGATLSTAIGATCVLMVRPSESHSSLAGDLLARSEDYLRSRGAARLLAGAARPVEPFYLGLYGGSQLSGLLDSDFTALRVAADRGYEVAARTHVLQTDLRKFRPPVERRIVQLRRRTVVEALADPPSRTWWEACTFGGFDRVRFELKSRDAGPPLASLVTWDMQPLATTWGVHAVGLVDLEVAAAERRHGLASLLLAETFSYLQRQGITLIEVQVQATDEVSRALFAKFGFLEVDQAVRLEKAAGP